MNIPNLIDRSLKVLIRRVPPAFFRLAGVDVDPAAVRFEDVSINLPEHRADQVMVIGDESDPDRWAMHLEYQLQPDTRDLRDWYLKNAALNAQLERPAILTVLYLSRGDRATFPSAYTISGGGLTNQCHFHTIRLWEHAERIRSGELAELAPLLVLCEDRPTEATLRRERELILGVPVSPAIRTDLLAVALMVGTRYFSRDFLYTVFHEEMQMLKEASFIEEWIEEGVARGEAIGEARGEAIGEARGARRVLLRQLGERFGELPTSVTQQIEQMDADECESLGARLLRAASLEELGLPGNGESESPPAE